MPELKVLAKTNGIRRYYRLRKADLIELIRTPLRENEPQLAIDEPSGVIDEAIIEQPQNVLSKSQLKRRRNKASKLAKKSNSLRIEINDLKSQKDNLEDKIKKATKSTSSRFKGKKIHSMKREATKLNERIQEKTKELRTIEGNPMLQTIVRASQQSKEDRRIKRKIEDMTRKIRRAKGKTKRNLMIKRDLLKLQLVDASPELIEGAFGGNYSKYKINGIGGMDLPTFFSKIRSSITNVLRRETSRRAIRSQTTTWIRFMKGEEMINLAFNSRMTPVYMLNDIDSIV